MKVPRAGLIGAGCLFGGALIAMPPRGLGQAVGHGSRDTVRSLRIRVST